MDRFPFAADVAVHQDGPGLALVPDADWSAWEDEHDEDGNVRVLVLPCDHAELVPLDELADPTERVEVCVCGAERVAGRWAA